MEMGEKKRYRIPMDFPFYTQRMTAENWEQEDFPSLELAEHWTFRSCGIASLRMLLDAYGKGGGSHWAMIEKGIAAGAYKDGVGWIHWGLAHMAEEYGLFAEALRGQSPAELVAALDEGCPCIISIAPFFLGGQPNPYNGGVYGKGGHLVPCFGYETEDGELTALLVHHPSAFAEKNIPEWWVPIDRVLASFGGNFIRFSAEPFPEKSNQK